jgi:hypothetical protein
MQFYYGHLESLSLVTWPVTSQNPVMQGSIQLGVTRQSKIQPTEFGRAFMGACIPESGFERFAKK